MKRILNIITDSNIGGAGNVLLNFMKKTDRSEFSHAVIVPQNALLTPRLRDLGVDVFEMADIGEKSFGVGIIAAFKREIAKHTPDVVHTHASLSARIAAKRLGCAVVHTRHCAYPQSRLKTSFPMKMALGFINNRYSDIIIAISPAARDNLTDTGTDPKKIVTMFNGVEPVRHLSDGEKLAVKNSLGIKENEFVCSIIARLVPEKGHDCVLDAAETLKGLPIRVVIAGGGPIEGQLREAVAARGLDNCVITGFIDDIAKIENITDLILNASYGTETSCLSALEGMSLGIPAVVSDFGGNPYLITDGESGTVFPQHDANALSAAILKLYEDRELLRRMGEEAGKVYEKRFTSRIMAENIEKVYRDVLPAKTTA